ncbi:MAG: hypothetical protein U9R19_12720 [Bacteroidota bacterium]|nr:hypothetical protein [Bacteroidota bacterium]
MKPILKVFLFTLIVFFSSCLTPGYWIVPQFTNVEKIVSITPGMDISEVNAALGIVPFDLYNLQDDGTSVLMYYYRTKSRKMEVPQDAEKRKTVTLGEERSQTEGDTWYSREHYILYVIMENGKVKSMLTDQGRKDGEYLLLVNNNIQSISSGQVTNYKMSVLDSAQYKEQLIYPLGNSLRKDDEAVKKKLNLLEQQLNQKKIKRKQISE